MIRRVAVIIFSSETLPHYTNSLLNCVDDPRSSLQSWREVFSERFGLQNSQFADQNSQFSNQNSQFANESSRFPVQN